MRTIATWVSRVTLSQEQLKELAGILSSESGSLELNGVADAMCHAAEHYQLPDEGMTLTEEKEETSAIISHLNALEKTLSKMPSAHLLDESYLFANNDELLLATRARQRDKESGFEAIVNKLRLASEDYLENLPKPGKGRTKDTTYSYGIALIARTFSENYPQRPLSSQKRTVFSNLIAFWLCTVMGVEIGDPKRHIDTALKLLAEQ